MRFSKTLAAAFVLLAGTAGSFGQSALLSKTWVSSTGSDTGTCDVTAPCGSFQYAFNQTTAGGEIEVVNPGRYGSLVITHTISVISSGPAATIGLNAKGTAITVQAGANDTVTLHGLILNGHGSSSTYGIAIYSGKSVIIDGCIIQGMEEGIYVNSSTTYVQIVNNLVTQNLSGILLNQNSYVVVGGNRIAGNYYGIYGDNYNIIYTYGDNDIYTNAFNDVNNVAVRTQSKF